MLAESIVHFRSIETHSKNLKLTPFEVEGDHVIEGIIEVVEQNNWYPIIKGVPCFLNSKIDLSHFKHKDKLPNLNKNKQFEGSKESSQDFTNITFSDKWRRFKNYGLEAQHEKFLFEWYCKKFNLPDQSALSTFYRDRERVLEVGPGSGFNSRFIARQCKGHVFALDVSEAAFTTFENTRQEPNCTVMQADLMQAPFEENYFDLIIADGVLHHTPNTFEAVKSLYKKLKVGGQFFFYVYKKMGAARQFCDQYIRESFTKLSAEDCYKACEGLTELGKELSRLDAKITLEKPIPVLGIPAGEHNVQRLFYYNFLKCFWNEAFDYETNNMVNFDWYHPHDAWQHTEEEVEGWLKQLGVSSYNFHKANPNGVSVLLTK
jgi:SAM-dependent methyltransferase